MSRRPAASTRCDGDGFVLDERRRGARRASAATITVQPVALEPAVVVGDPARYRGVSFDRSPVTELRPDVVTRRCARFVDDIDEQPRRGQRPLVHGRRRHRQDDARDARVEGGARAPATRSRSTRCRACWPRSSDTYDARHGERSYIDLFEPLVERRPPAPRRPRRREADRLGARAALLARQRALRAGALDRGHHQPHRRPRARGADRQAHGLPADRDRRRPDPALRPRTCASATTPLVALG